MTTTWNLPGRLIGRGLLALTVLIGLACFAEAADDLSISFVTPPDAAKPWVYWFWLNGNITNEGITADLEAMKRTGIAGVLIMDVDQGAPLGPVAFMSDTWRERFTYMVREAHRLGIEVNMNNDAGWNGSGGPWIQPEYSMQKVVFTETEIEGPAHFDGTLPQPQAVAGFYRDIAVLAFPKTGGYRIDNIQVKACYQSGYVGPGVISHDVAPEMKIARSALQDLSGALDENGTLSWDVPPGAWTVIRFGHTSTGVENAPSPASGRGLECDKLSKEGIEAHFNGMMAKLIADVGDLAGTTFAATHIDSWENGAQNWTARMREEFLARRGYDLTPFLPVMTGRVVDSLEISERFLWDLRQTISDLVVENYAGHLRELAQEHGLRLSIEAYGGPCDNAPYAGQADEPMAEFWIGGGGFPTPKEMTSAAHTYGKPVIGAEAFTAADQEKWLEHPASIKALGDRAFCDGINRFVFHRYALQPWADRKPGMTMGPWGIHYERTQTWWEQTGPWHDYLARCQHLLRQGLFVADIVYLQPETAPKSFMGHTRKGYDFDECSAEVVLKRMSVQDSRLVLPDGMTYRVLVLPDVTTMTPALLDKIRELVQAGATVMGPRPQKSPSLAGYPECDEEIQRRAGKLWGPCDGNRVKENRFGKGRIVWGGVPEKLLAQEGLRPDFESGERLNWIHRRVGDTDIYFVANPQPHDVATTCTFRVTGKRPEVWRPDNGITEPAALYSEKDGATSVPLSLEPSGSAFIVFRTGDTAFDPVVNLARNGAPLLSVTDPVRTILVTQARYGILEDPQRTQDVREKVQQLVDKGDRDFKVSMLAEEDDPAPQQLKTLHVEYTIGDRAFSVTGEDPAMIHISDEAMPVRITQAIYGVPGDAQRTRDVREKLQRLVDAGESSFQVARMAEGDDPAFLVVKTLSVEYAIGEEQFTAKATDPEIMYLAPHPVTTSEPTATVHRSNNGIVLHAWEPGNYAATTASGKTFMAEAPALPPQITLAGPWEVRFPENSGAPASLSLEALAPLNELPDPAVKYFSGTATYRTTFILEEDPDPENHPLWLDLGDVRVIAQVRLNHVDLPLLWKAPFRCPISGAAVRGENTLEVRVTNLWVNRLIGDEYLPEDSERNADGTLKSWPEWLNAGKPSPTGRHTFTTWRLWKKDNPLQPSGLLGPVMLRPAHMLQLEQQPSKN